MTTVLTVPLPQTVVFTHSARGSHEHAPPAPPSENAVMDLLHLPFADSADCAILRRSARQALAGGRLQTWSTTRCW